VIYTVFGVVNIEVLQILQYLLPHFFIIAGDIAVRFFIYTVRQKNEPILFSSTRQKLVIFFTYIKESISCSSVYLISACVENFV